MAKNNEKKGKSSSQNKKPDLMYILGFIIGTIMIVGSIIYNSPSKDGTIPASIDMKLIMDFYDMPSILITIGGTFTALMLSFPASYFTGIPSHLRIIMMPTIYDPREYITKIVEFATSARIEGILSLEKKLDAIDDTFLRTSMMLVVDSVDPEKVKQLLEAELGYLDERHSQARKIYDKGAAFGPAFGMIGTLIGLVKMLAQMNALGPDGIGPAMAVALITTFYGTVLANFIFSPISNKLRIRHEEEMLCKMIIVEGVEAIQSGENPRYIEEKLMMLLPDSANKPSKKKDKKQKA